MTPAPAWQKALLALLLCAVPGSLALTGCYLLARGFIGPHPLRRWQRTRALDRMLK